MCIALPAKVLSVANLERNLLSVDCFGQTRSVSAAALLASGQSAHDLVGHWVVLHQGFAMDRITAEEAAQTIAVLDGLSDRGAAVDVSEFQARQTARGHRHEP